MKVSKVMDMIEAHEFSELGELGKLLATFEDLGITQYMIGTLTDPAENGELQLSEVHIVFSGTQFTFGGNLYFVDASAISIMEDEAEDE